MRSASSLPQTRKWDPPTAFLLLIAFQMAAAQLVATNWMDDLALIQTLALLGVVVGLALGVSHFLPIFAFFVGLIYGLVAISWQIGQILGRGILWGERMAGLLSHMNVAIIQLRQQEDVTSPIFFLSIMSVIFWGLSVHAGYSLVRRNNPWRATLPAGFVMLVVNINNYHLKSSAWFLTAYIFIVLALVARTFFVNRHTRWRNSQAHIPLHMGFDMMGAALIAVVSLMMLAWNAPVMAAALSPARQVWQSVTEPWEPARERLNSAFASLRSSVGFAEVNTAYYGDTLPLGSGYTRTDELILTIETPVRPSAAMRYYWRARHYDYYADGVWSNTLVRRALAAPDNFSLEFPELTGRWDATVSFTTHIPITTLYTPPQPAWVNRAVELDLAYTPDGFADIAAMQTNPPLMEGDTYDVSASISNATVAELRAAGTDYPSWITRRYLQIPDTITPRTIELAHQIAAGRNNPYDIAAQITDYLRANLEYKDTVPPMPNDQELIDWLLFNLQQGFCNYYASAEVLLLRALGIPARLVVGFSQGEYAPIIDQEPTQGEERGLVVGAFEDYSTIGEKYTVRQQNAHAWPEIYFPNIGWVEFEPTANENPLWRILGDEALNAAETSGGTLAEMTEAGIDDGIEQQHDGLAKIRARDSEQDDFARKYRRPVFSLRIGLVLGAGMILIFVWRALRSRGLSPLPVLVVSGTQRINLRPPLYFVRWAQYASLSPVARAYDEINRALNRLGVSPAPTDTPAERTANLARILPELEKPLRNLLTEYHSDAYGPRPGLFQIARRAGRSVRLSSYLAWVRRKIRVTTKPDREEP